ncbi:cell division protein FtsQ/DivIB [Neobacillus dielmonensis]|uniref:cell division protein FtsQ/DivIB n=1 Tax=Neobacillus dielmonensis TaxID=1347369 RepID=UPI0005A6B118|nr:cell division protein FtsQ/DivIB [Neobacillus dielmonensis]
MEKSKIVALEDRIPKLKEQRRKKANKRLIILLFLFFVMIAVIAYTQSPLSHIKKIAVTGNHVYSQEEIISKSGLLKDTNIWEVKKADIKAKVKKLSEIKSADVKIQLPNKVLIKVNEYNRIAYMKQDRFYFPVMENGKILTAKKLEQAPDNAPILFGFEEGDILNEMVHELESLPTAILNSISEIHHTPKKTDQYHVSLYMNDGFEVSATIRSFSEKMVHYPSIISQLDPNKKGIIDLEVGSYFKAFETEVEEKEVENDEGEG